MEIGTLEFWAANEHKGEREEEVESRENQVAFEGTQPHEEREHGPGKQENAESRADAFQMRWSGFVSFQNPEAWNRDSGVRQPESPVGSEGGGAECVAWSEFPHACNHLPDSAIEDRETRDNVARWVDLNSPDSSVVARQHERGYRKREQTQRRRVGKSHRWR